MVTAVTTVAITVVAQIVVTAVTTVATTAVAQIVVTAASIVGITAIVRAAHEQLLVAVPSTEVHAAEVLTVPLHAAAALWAVVLQ